MRLGQHRPGRHTRNLCRIILLAAATCCAAGVGCASSSTLPRLEEPSPDQPAAVIKTTKGGNLMTAYRVTVDQIDGKVPVARKPQPREPGIDLVMRVAPGNHELTVTSPNVGRLRIITTFTFPFAAGHVYRIDRIGPTDQRPKVVDETNGRQVPIYAKDAR